MDCYERGGWSRHSTVWATDEWPAGRCTKRECGHVKDICGATRIFTKDLVVVVGGSRVHGGGCIVA